MNTKGKWYLRFTVECSGDYCGSLDSIEKNFNLDIPLDAKSFKKAVVEAEKAFKEISIDKLKVLINDDLGDYEYIHLIKPQVSFVTEPGEEKITLAALI